MGRMKHILITLIVILSLIFVCGCTDRGNKDIDGPNGPDVTPVQDEIDDPVITSVISNDEFSLITIEYYTVIPDTATLKSSTALVRTDSDITPVLILDYLCDSLEDESVELSYNGADLSDGICTIDFDESIVRISEESAELEMAILDAAAQSILDNIEGCRGVRVILNGASYSTQNLKFSLNDIYMDD